MELMLKITWRNIQRHKGKSSIIGIILFFGTFIMTVGNSVISGMERGLQENIVKRFTGDIVLISTNQKDENVVTTGMLKGIQTISGYTDIKSILKNQSYIDSFLPAGRGNTMVLNENGEMSFSYILGVDFDEYRKMFGSNIVLIEGKCLSDGEKGILITAEQREAIYESQEFWLIPESTRLNENNLSEEARLNLGSLDIRSNIVLMGMSADESRKDIRSPVFGIFRYKYLNAFWNSFNIMDIESFRECMGYTSASDKKISISVENEKLLKISDESPDNLFSEDMVENIKPENSNLFTLKKLHTETKKKVEYANSQPDSDTGTYNIVLIKLKNSKTLKQDLKKLNSVLSNSNAGARAVSWKNAAGQIGDYASVIKSILNAFVIFIFFVATVIIMNTLSMSAIERTNEIGMMRAIGAGRIFIRNMFFTETAILSFSFGGCGIIFATAAINILSALNINSQENNIVQLFFGGDIFHPVITVPDLFTGILELSFVTFLAVLYPLKIAGRITPLEAIAKD